VFSREVAKLGDGDFTAHINLRRKDMFLDTAAEMNDSFASLRSRAVILKDIAQRLEEAHAQGTDTGELIKNLQSELSHVITEDVEQ